MKCSFYNVAQASCLSRMAFRETQPRWLCYLMVLVLVGCRGDNEGRMNLAEAIDESAGNVPCYLVTTPTATYYLEKEGGGLSSMIDADGVDWIGFHKKAGTESNGEYRGFPNAIYKEDGSFFHALNAGTDKSTSEVTIDGSNHIRIVFTSGNGLWTGQWDFFPTHCTFFMKEVSSGFHYWILYEGVPGGKLDKEDFWFSSKDSSKHLIDEKQEEDLPDPEWMAFGDPGSARMLFLKHHEDDNFTDRYYNMRDEMTVFGFGRDGIKRLLNTPQHFSIGFVESKEYQAVDAHIRSINY